MKHYYLFLFLFTILNIQAQKYELDRIRLQEKEYDYRFHHLEQYFNYYPEKRFVPTKDSTIINRGYIAHYEIYNDEIYLRDILTKDPKSNNENLVSVRDKYSPSTEERIPLRWINGVVVIGLGTDDFKNDSLYPTNTNNLILEIQRGKVKRRLQLGKEEMRIFKNFQWEKFKNTFEYVVLHRKLERLGLNDLEIDIHLYNNVFYYSKKIFLQK